MGCDGGSIPKRDEMVKLKKKAEKAQKAIELAAKWRYCALRSEKLQQPVVGCELGRLYNKESVLMALLDKPTIPETANHLRSLKDVVQLQLTPNPDYKPSEKSDAYNDLQTGEFICPVTGVHMNGQHRFVFFRDCGCVVSEKALKEVPSSVCHKCGKPFVKEDVIIINGTDEEVEEQRKAMEERRQAVRLAKRKRKAETTETVASTSSSVADKTSSDSMEVTTSAIPASTASVDSSSKDEPKEKRSKIVPSKPAVKSTKPKTSTKPSIVSNGDTKGLKKRDAYKSLFSSSVPARPKERTSNWVTFFPYH